MTDPAAPPPQNLAFIKAVTVGLGLLLVGGVALLCVLLVTRDGGAGRDGGAVFALAPGERFVAAAPAADGVLLTIEDEGGHRLVTLRPDGTVEAVLLVTDAPSVP